MSLRFKTLKLPFRPLRPEETSSEAIERVHKKLQARFARCGNMPMALRDCCLPQLAVFQCVQRYQDIYAISGQWNWNDGNGSLILYLKDRSHKEQIEQLQALKTEQPHKTHLRLQELFRHNLNEPIRLRELNRVHKLDRGKVEDCVHEFPETYGLVTKPSKRGLPSTLVFLQKYPY
jgi:hypothetical protein